MKSAEWKRALLRFNSSMVRLEEHRPLLQFPPCKGFNSSMVRLEVRMDLTKAVATSLFQFQYGSIRRRRLLSQEL